MDNIIIPSRHELDKIVRERYALGSREGRQSGTNCCFEIVNYMNHSGKPVRLVVKKSFLRSDPSLSEGDYILLKTVFKNIIPNQVFIPGKDGVIFAFCAPVAIKLDICAQKNRDYVLELLKTNTKLRKQLEFFIRNFKILQEKGKIIDLYGDENLVISDDNKLYFVDSFLVFSPNNLITTGSISNLEYLTGLLDELESIYGGKMDEGKSKKDSSNNPGNL